MAATPRQWALGRPAEQDPGDRPVQADAAAHFDRYRRDLTPRRSRPRATARPPRTRALPGIREAARPRAPGQSKPCRGDRGLDPWKRSRMQDPIRDPQSCTGSRATLATSKLLAARPDLSPSLFGSWDRALRHALACQRSREGCGLRYIRNLAGPLLACVLETVPAFTSTPYWTPPATPPSHASASPVFRRGTASTETIGPAFRRVRSVALRAEGAEQIVPVEHSRDLFVARPEESPLYRL